MPFISKCFLKIVERILGCSKVQISDGSFVLWCWECYKNKVKKHLCPFNFGYAINLVSKLLI